MPKSGLLESFNNAVEGFIYISENERKLKIYFLIFLVVLISSIFLGLDLIKILFLLTGMFIVIFSAIVNSIVEYILDTINDKPNPNIKIIRDVAASGVLISFLFYFAIVYVLFIPYFVVPFGKTVLLLKHSSWRVPIVSILIVLSFVILGKVIFYKGRPLRGGMPSGHSAAAFSIWTVTALGQSNILITSLVFMLAILVVRSRTKYAIHTIWEALAGSLLGVSVTLFIYQLFLR